MRGCSTGPLAVRGPQPGDRLRPLGAPGARKLQDVFVDLRVPASERPLQAPGGVRREHRVGVWTGGRRGR